jgi:hypothetical protein
LALDDLVAPSLAYVMYTQKCLLFVVVTFAALYI